MTNDEERFPLRLSSKQYDEIEKNVVQLYIDCGISSLPIDPYHIIKSKGYVLIPFSELTEEELVRIKSVKKDAVSFWNKDKKQFVICYDEKGKKQRIRFTLMHEVGHIIMGHKQESALAKKIADVFAAYSLAPYPLIYSMHCKDVVEVMFFFDISAWAAEIAFNIYQDWLTCGVPFKDYERTMIELIKN